MFTSGLHSFPRRSRQRTTSFRTPTRGNRVAMAFERRSDDYLLGTWVPHCTLAMDVVDPSPVAAVAMSLELPFSATVTQAHIVDVATGASAARVLWARVL